MDGAEAFGEGLRGKQRILALAEFGVVEVNGEREQVDGDGVGEGGLGIAGAGLLVDAGFAVDEFRRGAAGGGVGWSVIEGGVAIFPGILAGLTANVGEGLVPDQIGEALVDARRVHEGVADVDEEFKGEVDLIFSPNFSNFFHFTFIHDE